MTDFTTYAEACFRLFGDRAKQWITLNEPFMYCNLGYDLGVLAPGLCGFQSPAADEMYTAGHYMLLAHAAAVEAYRSKYKAE